MYSIRKLSNNHMDDAISIIANAFHNFYSQFTSADIANLRARYVHMNQYDDAVDFYGCFIDKQLVGVMRLYNFTMNFNQTLTHVGGVGEVAVDLFHKREKVAFHMIDKGFRISQQRGIPFIMLYPFNPAFYKKMGFGLGPKVHLYSIPPDELPSNGKKENVVLLNDNDITLWLNCAQRYHLRTHGSIAKTDFEIKRSLNTSWNKIICYKKDNQITGYMIVKFKSLPQSKINPFVMHMTVHELVYQDSESLMGLLTFLHSQKDQVQRIEFSIHDDEFPYIVDDPRDDSQNYFYPLSLQSNRSAVGLMYRIIDLPGWFTQLKQHNFNDQSLKLQIKLQEDFLHPGQQIYAMDFKNGYPNTIINGNEDYEVSIEMKVCDFSSLMMGAIGFRKLYQYGLTSISREDYIDKVDSLFAVKDKPVNTAAF